MLALLHHMGRLVFIMARAVLSALALYVFLVGIHVESHVLLSSYVVIGEEDPCH
jgi:hypothetical protein